MTRYVGKPRTLFKGEPAKVGRQTNTQPWKISMPHADLTIQSPSTLGSWVMLIAQTVDSYGVDSQTLFKEAGIDLTGKNNAETRFQSSMVALAWQDAVLKTQDPYIAIRVAQLFKSTTYSALGMAMAASRNVYDAMKRCIRYSHIVSEGTLASMEENDEQIAFVLSSRPQFHSHTHIYGISATLCCLFKIFREIGGESLTFKEVHFEQALESKLPFEHFFGCPIYYDSNCNKAVIEKKQAYLEQPFIHTELSCSLDKWIEAQLEKHQNNQVSTQVNKYLLENIATDELDLAKVASDFAMSIRMLQRKLQQEGTTYKQLLNDFRKAHAIKLITQQKLPLSQVSLLLGFNDQSNFTRAFKRWTGTTPYKYR